MLDKVVTGNDKVVFRNNTGLAVDVAAAAVDVIGDVDIVAVVSGCTYLDASVVEGDNKSDTHTPQVRGHDALICVIVSQNVSSLSQSSMTSRHSKMFSISLGRPWVKICAVITFRFRHDYSHGTCGRSV